MKKANQTIKDIKENLLNGKCLVNLALDVMEVSFFVIKDSRIFTCILDLDNKNIYDYDNEDLKILYEDIEKELFQYDIQITDWFNLLESDYKNNLLNLYYL